MHAAFALPRNPLTRRGLVPRLLVVPMIVGLLAFSIYPFVYLVFLSASRSLLGKTFQHWVGSDNFSNALEDQVFIDALIRSILFAIPVSVIELVFGVAIAVLLQHNVRGGHLIRTVILLPLMTPPLMVATAWKLILNPTGGLLNGVLLDLGLIDKPVSYLGSSQWAFPSVGLADAWQWTPFVILLAFAALQTLPEEVMQAALVDGGTPWRTFWSITLPMVAPALLALFLIRLITAFKVFDLVFALTGGGPGFDTNLGTFQIYRVALQKFDVGYGAAQTLIFAALVGLVTLPIVLLRDWSVKHWS